MHTSGNTAGIKLQPPTAYRPAVVPISVILVSFCLVQLVTLPSACS